MRVHVRVSLPWPSLNGPACIDRFSVSLWQILGECLDNLATTVAMKGGYQQALPLYDEALDHVKTVVGTWHKDTGSGRDAPHGQMTSDRLGLLVNVSVSISVT